MILPMTRGFRNNNPANIRISTNKWIGKKKINTDKTFEQFTSMTYGVRALVVLLRNYYYSYNLNTIEKIISRYAPDNENNTKEYINYVSQNTYYNSEKQMADPTTETGREMYANLCAAIIAYENGTNLCRPYFIGLAYYWLWTLS